MRALRMGKRQMPPAIAAHVAHEVCRALDYVHNLASVDGEPLKVIHRDVTPSNIVLTSAGALKLLDFGVAKYDTSEARTQHRAVKGKPAYLAPEELEGKSFDCRVDVFSLGIVLHEMLTLTSLFAGDSELITMRKVLEMPIPSVREARPDVPEALDAIVMRALARDLGRRYPSAAEMARDLNEFVLTCQLHDDEIVRFVSDIQALLAAPRASLAAIIAGSADTMPAAAEHTPAATGEPDDDGATKRDLALRFRMSRLGRLIFGSDDEPPPK